MNLLSARDLAKSYGERSLFTNVGFTIEEGEKVGLVGVNGCGKTTLFRIIAGMERADSGTVSVNRLTTIGYMEQHGFDDLSRGLYEEVHRVFAHLTRMEAELEDIARRIEEGELDLIHRQHTLNEAYLEGGGLTTRSRTRAALLGFGFREEDFSLPLSALSGGQRAKAQLAKLILSGPSLLRLDEPTNHLDIEAATWLEDYLRDYRGAVLVISHDRYFLDRVTGRTLELEHGKLTSYQGGYSQYMDKKEEDGLIAQRHYANVRREAKRIEGIIAQQKQWNRERNIRTAESKQKQLDRLLSGVTPPDKAPQRLRFHFDTAPFGGQDVLVAKGLSKSYPEKPLFRELDLTIRKGEKVAVLGPNSAGKTTLLNIIMGKLLPDTGMVMLGANIKTAYYDQTQSTLHPQNTILQELQNAFPRMTDTQLRTALGVFLFRGDDVFATIDRLSGGEKARVALLKMMLSGANFLLLDEPTNHLDIASREALEQALLDYDGTILMVSHDRYFVNRLADRVLAFTPKGVTSILGGYDDYLAALEAGEAAPQKGERPERGADYRAKKEEDRARRKLQNRVTRLEESIGRMEECIEALRQELADPQVATQYQRAMELSDVLREKEAELQRLYQEWEEASTFLIEMEK